MPTIDLVTQANDDRAEEIAWARLASSQHYFVAELRDGDRKVCRLEKPAASSAGERHQDP